MSAMSPLPNSIRNLISLLLLLLPLSHALRVPIYNYTSHPMYTHPSHFSGSPPPPVIMRRYTMYIMGRKETHGMYFTPGKASYRHFNSKAPFCNNLDLLHIPRRFSPRTSRFVEIDLSQPARVFLLITTFHNRDHEISNVRTVRGLGSRWRNPQTVKSTSAAPVHVGSKARGTDYILPSQALAVERLYRAGETIILPDPGSVRLNGRIQAAQYLLLFARADNPRDFPVPFPYPQTPRSVKHVVSGNARKPKPVRPNEPCPIWLHDSYVESTRDARVARKENEPLFWRTWHAMIDPVYWCYYDHEHGSYPGYYRPMFGYTAWKTRDESTPHKRQIETHRGFKIFTYPFYDQNRFAVITVHMHASLRRRFYTRHHTMIFTILDRNWNIEMELHMKLDFGFAAVTLKNGKNMPLGKEDEQIIKELHSNARMRRFNVLNLKNYPKNLDSKYEMKNNVPPTMKNERLISLGTYERWVAPPNTCSGGRNGRPVPFNFDFRHVATSIQDIKRYKTAPMQRLHGSSIDRMLLIGGDVGPLDVAKRLCKFEGGNMPSADLFYTDPYFKRLERQSGRNSVRNFWRMGFKGVRFSLGKMTPVDVWAGHYEMEKRKEDRRHMQLERAVIADVN